jgi:hypothetical protein
MADRETLLEVMDWNRAAMDRAKKDGRERDVWRHSNNAEFLRSYIARMEA